MDSSSNGTTTSTAPSNSSLSASAIVIPMFSLVASFLCVPPLVTHIAARNLPAIVLVAGIIIENIQNCINALNWPRYPSEDMWDGQGLCDVEVKLYIGIGVATAGAVASIFRQLALALDTDKAAIVPSNKDRYLSLAFEIGLCVALPIYTMAAHYIVQRERYYLIAVSGCVPVFYPNWVTYVLITMWPVVLCAVGAGYCVLTIYRLIRYRRSVSSILSNSSTITKGRYFRLLGLAIGLLLVYLPLAAYTLASTANYVSRPYSWSEVHHSRWSNAIVRLDPDTAKEGYYRPFDRWCQVGVGFVHFLLFGLGHEAIVMYKSWLAKLGWLGLEKRLDSTSSISTQNSGPAELATSHSSRAPVRDAFDVELAMIDKDCEMGQSSPARSN